MIRYAFIPDGTYSVTVKTLWNNECIGQNGFQHHIIRIPEYISKTKLEDQLVDYINKEQESANCVCRNVEIMAMSMLQS